MNKGFNRNLLSAVRMISIEIRMLGSVVSFRHFVKVTERGSGTSARRENRAWKPLRGGHIPCCCHACACQHPVLYPTPSRCFTTTFRALGRLCLLPVLGLSPASRLQRVWVGCASFPTLAGAPRGAWQEHFFPVSHSAKASLCHSV